MKIYFERTGGFAGLRLSINLDLEFMPAGEAESLQKLIDEANLFTISEPENKPGMADSFQYKIIIEQNGKQRTLQFGDGTVPIGLQALVNDLSLRARSQRR
jgi:hypothetical protein